MYFLQFFRCIFYNFSLYFLKLFCCIFYNFSLYFLKLFRCIFYNCFVIFFTLKKHGKKRHGKVAFFTSNIFAVWSAFLIVSSSLELKRRSVLHIDSGTKFNFKNFYENILFWLLGGLTSGIIICS